MSTVERKLSHGTTVADLIAELEGLPQDAVVLFACDYGDYVHTQQALPVSEVIACNSNRLEESGYSRSGIALREESDDDENEEAAQDDRDPLASDGRTVVILR